jgi:hypothetical protein
VVDQAAFTRWPRKAKSLTYEDFWSECERLLGLHEVGG